MLVVIDGTAGSGKSSTARRVAESTGYVLMDSGLMYRAVAWVCLDRGILCEEPSLAALLDTLQLEVRHHGVNMHMHINKSDITDKLRSATVSEMASRIAQSAVVRSFMLTLQRDLGDRFGLSPGLVAEGRDMGTIVFPKADLKFFFTASVNVRAARRRQQLQELGMDASLEGLQTSLAQRDRADSERDLAPLKQAPDAISVNTDHITLDEQVALVLEMIREHAAGAAH